MCETPPVMNRKRTRLAFGLKCGAFGASGFSGSPAIISERMPGRRRPPAARDRMACLRIIGSVHEQEEVAAEHGVHVAGPRPGFRLGISRCPIFVLQPGEKLF